MIIIEADFNNVREGRVNLSLMKRHAETPFTQIAAVGGRVLFVDFEEAVFGSLEQDAASGHWLAVPDWTTQHQIVPLVGRPPYEGFRQRSVASA